MAFTPSLTLSLTSPQVIANAAANFVVGVVNAGVTAGSVTSLTLVATPTSGVLNLGAINLGPNVSLSVGGSSTVYYPCQLVFQTPRHSLGVAMPINQFLVHVEALFADGTAASSPLISVLPNNPLNTPAGIGASSLLGQVRFDNGINSSQLVLVSPP